MKTGEYPQSKISRISIIPGGNKPAIFTVLETGDKDQPELVHVIRLSNPDSRRIGLDELRGAMPITFLGLTDAQMLKYLVMNTSKLIGTRLAVAVEPQLDADKKPVCNPKTGEAYFNVRLRSGAHDLTEAAANSVVDALFANLTATESVDKAFAEASA
jgi:hypothetical protein